MSDKDVTVQRVPDRRAAGPSRGTRSRVVRAATRSVQQLGRPLFIVLVAAFALTPVYVVWVTGFKTQDEILSGPLSVPDQPRFENFVDVLQDEQFALFFLNSALVALPVVLAVLIFSTLAGFALARWDFRGSRIVFLVLLVGIMVPLESLMVPLYYELRSLGLLDSLWGLILPQIGWNFAFGAIWMRAYYRSLGSEYTDAAYIDGATMLQMIRYVIVPLARPALLTLAVLTFVFTWNEFLLPLVVTTDPNNQTVPLGLAFYVGRRETDFPLLMAAATLISMPVVLVSLFFQRAFLRGVLSGGTTG